MIGVADTPGCLRRLVILLPGSERVMRESTGSSLNDVMIRYDQAVAERASGTDR